MTDRVTVNRDKTALLPPNSPHKGYRITREEAAELGLVASSDKPVQERRTGGVPDKVGPFAKAPKPAAKPQTRRSAPKKGK